jgi:hypothetical protein
MRRTLVVSAGLLAVVLAATAFAGAGRIESSVSLQLGPEPGKFKGHVRSDVERCVKRRRVVIKKKRPGNDVPVAEGRTGVEGRYVFRTGEQSGSWYAQIRGENLGPSDVPCKGDRSRTRSAG